MPRTRGFTLLEIMLALTVTGLVAALAYGALQAGLDTGSRLTSHTAAAEATQVARAMIAQAVRHAVPGIRGGDDVFSLSDRVGTRGEPADSLAFLSRGVVEPFGTGDAWRVVVWREGDSTRLEARREWATELPAIASTIRGDDAFDVTVLGRGDAADAWRSTWDEPDVTPDAIAFAWGRGSAGARSVVRIGLERAP